MLHRCRAILCDMKDDHCVSLLEDLHGKFDAVAEAVSGVAQDVQSLKADVHSIDDRLDHVEQDITAIGGCNRPEYS